MGNKVGLLTVLMLSVFLFGGINARNIKAEIRPDAQTVIEEIVLRQVSHSRFIKVEVNNDVNLSDSILLHSGKNILIHFIMEMLPDWEARDIVNWFSQDCYEIFKDIYHDDWNAIKIPVNEVSIYGYLNRKLLCRVILTGKDATYIDWGKVSVFDLRAFISKMETYR